MQLVRHTRAAFVAAMAAAALVACSDTSTGPTPAKAVSSLALGRSEGYVDPTPSGAVYTLTNAIDGNSVIAFRRDPDGELTRIGAFPTGGLGVGGTVDPLESQFAVVLSQRHDALFAVNAGSDELSSFRVERDGRLSLVSRASSGGERPVSIAVHDRLLYVLNTNDNTLVGFRVAPDARLIPIAKSRRSLASGADGAAAVRFTPDGHQLIVSERVSNRLEVFRVGDNGRLSEPVVSQASGGASFGFDITARNEAIVSETQGSVTSYALSGRGALTPITSSISTGGVAPCWVIITSDEKFAYATNTGTSSIAEFSIAAHGVLASLSNSPTVVTAGSIPLDLDQVQGRLLYTLETGKGTIGGFVIGSDGRLTGLSEVTVGAPRSGFQGLAAF
jgi:6-phosphogluconolactonase (cycloisomerase 2 family)